MLLYALSTPAINLCLGHTACVYTTTFMNFRITYDIQFLVVVLKRHQKYMVFIYYNSTHASALTGI